jgi:Lon protease-like protein
MTSELATRNDNLLRTDASSAGAEPASGSRPEGAAPSRPIPEDALIIVPVRNIVAFPGMVFPLTVGRERSRAAAYEAARLQRPLGILLQTKAETEQPNPGDLHWVGTTANVLRYITAPDGAHHAICQGVQRFRALQFLEGYPFLVARVQLIPESAQGEADVEGRAQALKERAAEILGLLPQVPDEVASSLQSIERSRAARRLHRRPDGHRRRGEAGAARDVRSQDAHGHAARACSRTGSRCSRFRATSPSARAARSTTCSASTCCASRCARSRRSWARARRALRKSRSSTRRSPTRRCPRKSRSRRARS